MELIIQWEEIYYLHKQITLWISAPKDVFVELCRGRRKYCYQVAQGRVAKLKSYETLVWKFLFSMSFRGRSCSRMKEQGIQDRTLWGLKSLYYLPCMGFRTTSVTYPRFSFLFCNMGLIKSLLPWFIIKIKGDFYQESKFSKMLLFLKQTQVDEFLSECHFHIKLPILSWICLAFP